MILGFAHITENSVGYEGQGLANPPEKWPLMVRRAERHHVALQYPGPASDLSVTHEFVQYDTGVVQERGRLGVLDDGIFLRVQDEDAETRFFRDGLGFDGHGHLRLLSQIREWRVSVFTGVDPEAPLDPPLDIDGYAALAFYSSDVEADRKGLLVAGGRLPTQSFTVKVGGREMKIVMLRSPEGTIIELIQVLK